MSFHRPAMDGLAVVVATSNLLVKFNFWVMMCNISTMFIYPTSQSELVRTARGIRTQAQFAKLLGCDRSCLSRYEREQLGAPPAVISQCLRIVASAASAPEGVQRSHGRVLAQARRLVAELELLGNVT